MPPSAYTRYYIPPAKQRGGIQNPGAGGPNQPNGLPENPIPLNPNVPADLVEPAYEVPIIKPMPNVVVRFRKSFNEALETDTNYQAL
jgi:hypothetical protein